MNLEPERTYYYFDGTILNDEEVTEETKTLFPDIVELKGKDLVLIANLVNENKSDYYEAIDKREVYDLLKIRVKYRQQANKLVSKPRRLKVWQKYLTDEEIKNYMKIK